MRSCAAALSSLVALGCESSPEVLVGRLHVSPKTEDAARPPIDAAKATRPGDGQSKPSMGLEAGIAPDAARGRDSGSNQCEAPGALHDYLFTLSGTGAAGSSVADAQGGEAAKLFGGAQLLSAAEGRGVRLDGVDDFVQLPSRMLAGLQSTTLSVWFVVDGGPGYVRLLDFGRGSTAEPSEGDGSVGRSYLALTPATGLDQPKLAALASADGAANELAIGTDLEVRDGVLHRASLAFDASEQQLRLYLDGELLGARGLTFELSQVDDRDNWIGRSHYDADPYLGGTIRRAVVYDVALTDCQEQRAWGLGVTTP
ncbi:MAG TPA: LamG domain-containing protein [Polyangiaceae bacterium]|nr:LamG domain-containing protein [Polyangiaceae bacterium]